MNLRDPHVLQRLANASRFSRKALRAFRAKRRQGTKLYVGSNYSDNGTEKAQVLNLIAQGVDIFSRHLAARAPRARFSTTERAFRRTAARGELRAAQLAEELELAVTFQQVVKEAMFGPGIVKTGLASGEQVEIDDETFDVGQPYTDVVQLDDWVHDTTVPEWRKTAFRGNKYSPRIDCLRDTFDGKTMDRIAKNVREPGNVLEDGGERADAVGHGRQQPDNEFAPRACLWNFYFPYEQVMGTFLADPASGELMWDNGPIDLREYVGPPGGPFDMLGFRTVPGNIMPLPPAAQMLDLHEAANRAMRKLIQSANAEKDIIGAQLQSKEDANRVRDASHLEVLALTNPQGIQDYHFGGPNNLTMVWALWLKDLFVYTNGNLEMLGGLGAMSDTLGQDKMLMATASKQVQEMQDRVLGFAKAVFSKLIWWDWRDPVTDQRLVQTLRSSGEPVTVTLTAEERQQVDVLDLNIDIHPYSMQYQSPGERLATIGQVWQQYVLPAMQAMQAQGMTPNFDALLRLVGKYANLPEIEEIITFGGESTLPEAGVKAPQSPVTTRNTVRTGRSQQNTPRGRETQMLQRLLGQGQETGVMR